MLKKIDQYFLTYVIKMTIAGQIGFFGVFIFIDLLDKAFKIKAPEGKSHILFLCEYYASQCPMIFQITLPFIFVLASLITMAKFQHNSQIVAINAAGISTHRITLALFGLSLVLGSLIILSQEVFTPKMTKWRLSYMEDDMNFSSNRFLSFRDNISGDQGVLPQHHSAMIDLEAINYKQKQGKGFHATLMDKMNRPMAKIYGKSFHWNTEEVIQLKDGFSLIYSDKSRRKNFVSQQIQITIPIKKVLLASKELDALNFWDLNHFNSNLEIYSEQVYRIMTPFFPFLMMLISSVIAGPFIFSKPVYGYFIGLGCSFGVFFLTQYLKSEIMLGELSAQLMISSIFIIAFMIYAWRRRYLPT